MQRRTLFHLPLTALLAAAGLGLFGTTLAQAQVKAWEEPLTIPTYLVDPPNPMPRYYEGKTHQGVQRRIYPYPLNDDLTRNKADRDYPIVYFENEYLKLGIMPGMGGRIFSGEDKTNGYDFFYRQHVIKPSLIGMLGYWTSGSMAWGFPHHHGPNTVKPMDYRIVENADGSRTIWIADFDHRHRMRILIGYTVYPHSSLVEMTIRPANRTPLVNSMLFWANPSVHVNENYQVIFPPSVRYVTQHAKHEMATWPVPDGRYNDFEYKGVDVSWWKNIGVPSSLFAWNPQEDYFGGYDHGKKAGTVWLGNHYTSPGMKFWAWGNNRGGKRADAMLTDSDGPYIELMAGAYTDNQPDYSWLQPYEGKDVKMFWFPIRELGGLKFANFNGALNLDVTDKGLAQVRLNTTGKHRGAKAILVAKGKVVFEEAIDIAPDKPYSKDVSLPAQTGADDLRLSLVAADGSVLLTYAPAEHKPSGEPKPAPLDPPATPDKIKTIEELYYTGLRLDQFHNASLEARPYYEEALKRDAGDYRVNTQLGLLALQKLNWLEAEKRLQTAVDRITARYTRARDGEAQFYLGLALRAQGRLDEAYVQLYNATWSAAWHTAAYYQLAEIDCQRGDTTAALDHVERAISTNVRNLKALNLKTVILRESGRLQEAAAQAVATAQLDPLDHQSRNELAVLETALGQKDKAAATLADLSKIMRDDVQSYIELATDYANCGGEKEAIDVLARLEAKGEAYPMIYYLTGYYWSKLGDQAKAAQYYRIASQKPHTYCFPSRGEELEALLAATRTNPKDARPFYYLGNLLFEGQPARATEMWETSRSLDDTFYIVHRNLGLAYEKIQNDLPKAIKSVEQAVACNADDPRLLYELDDLYEKSRVSPEQRYALLKKNEKTAAGRSETRLRLANLSVQVGRYDEALEFLLHNEVPQWEGGRDMQEALLDSYVLRGLDRFDRKQYREALQDFQSALAFPLERWGRGRMAQFNYLAGTAHEALGEADSAKAFYQKAVDVTIGRYDQQHAFYQGQAQMKLGRTDEAKKTFEGLIAAAKWMSAPDFFRQFEGRLPRNVLESIGHYLAGLGHIGLGDSAKARAELEQSIALDPSNIWTKRFLSTLPAAK